MSEGRHQYVQISTKNVRLLNTKRKFNSVNKCMIAAFLLCTFFQVGYSHGLLTKNNHKGK